MSRYNIHIDSDCDNHKT